MSPSRYPRIRQLDDFDLILAACALANDLALVTNNVKHFERIEGFRLTNWVPEPP
jgi:tRNA(fMet)-specific endonuclease VapC